MIGSELTPDPHTFGALLIGVPTAALLLRAMCDRMGPRFAARVDRWRDRIRNT